MVEHPHKSDTESSDDDQSVPSLSHIRKPHKTSDQTKQCRACSGYQPQSVDIYYFAVLYCWNGDLFPNY